MPARLPTASQTNLGGVKVDNSTIIINNDGAIVAQYGDSNVKYLLESGINTNIQTSANIIGNGSQITSINADNIETGTINNSRLPDDITISQDLVVNRNLTIKGTLNLEGEIINTQTEVQISDELLVTNLGTGTAVIINQKGENAIIDIQDNGVSSFYIKDGGYVGIGTTSPSEKLQVNGNVKATSFIGNGTNITELDATKITTGTVSPNRLPNASDSILGVVKVDNSTIIIDNNGAIAAQYGNSDVQTLLETGISTNIQTSANIIGNGSQITNLNAGNIISGTIDNERLPNNIAIGNDLQIGGDLTLTGKIESSDSNVKISKQLIVENSNTGPALIVNQTGIGAIVDIRDNNSSILYVEDDGYVGIGTTNPTEKLEVNGKIKATYFIGNGSQITNLDADNITTGTILPTILPTASQTDLGGVKVDNTTILINDGVISGAAQYVDSNVTDLLADGINTNIQTTANIIGNDIIVNNDLTINGKLNLVGEVTTTETKVQISEQLVVENNGTGPAVIINQTGDNAIIDIQDDGISSFYIKNDGNVGIGTTNPSEKLEIDGKIKVSDGIIFNSSTLFNGSYNDLNNKLQFSTDYFIDNNNTISLNAGAIAGLSVNNQGNNIRIDAEGKINVAEYAIGSYSSEVYTDLYSLTQFAITYDQTDTYKLIYDGSISDANKLNKGDIIKFDNDDYKRVYHSTDTYFTIYDNIDHPDAKEDKNISLNYISYNKVNYKLLFDFTGDFNNEPSSSNNILIVGGYTKLMIPKTRVYSFNINVNFDLTYGTSYSVLYVHLKRNASEQYIRTFYSPSITPAYHNFSSSINASFKIKLQQGDEITFESNYKLQEGFIDIDL